MVDRPSYPALSALAEDLSRITDAVAPRVITIDVGGRWTATGTVWRDGVVVTTAHAIRDTERLRVLSHGAAPRSAIFGGWDLGTDLAVLKVEGLRCAAPPEAEGEVPAREIRAGRLAVVMAAGRGGATRARLAMITGVGPLDRARRGARLARVIELDILPFPGFSGGPLVDDGGRVVAVNTAAIVRGVPLGLPVDLVARVIDELLVRGRVSRGYLGVGTHPVRTGRPGADEAPSRGLLVHSLEPGGPAERAGTLVGDILVSIEGRPLASPEELVGELGDAKIGESVQLGVMRGGNRVEIPVVVGERPSRTDGRHCHGR